MLPSPVAGSYYEPDDDDAIDDYDGDYVHKDPVIAVIRPDLERKDTDQEYQGVRGMWGKRAPELPRKKAKMEEIRRWGKRSQNHEKHLRGMWGKRETQKPLYMMGFKPTSPVKSLAILNNQAPAWFKMNGMRMWGKRSDPPVVDPNDY